VLILKMSIQGNVALEPLFAGRAGEGEGFRPLLLDFDGLDLQGVLGSVLPRLLAKLVD